MTDNCVRVGMIGTGNWANAGHLHVYQKHPRAKLIGVCDVVSEKAQRAAEKFGAGFATTDYSALLARDDIDAVDIATPNVMHAPIALAALGAGKHIICEKPMAMNYREAWAMAQAVRGAGVKTAINFVYRGHPAAQFAHHLVQEGYIGRIFQVNAFYMQSWLVDPQMPLVWRLQKGVTGTGTLGDLGSHIIDLAEWITGERIKTLLADMQTFVPERPLLDNSGIGQVDVDDGANFLARFENGAMGTFVSSRYGTGHQNYQRLEVYGEQGALIYSVDDVDHIQVALGPAFVKERVMTSMPVPRRFKSSDESSHFARQNRPGIIHAFIEAILDDKEMQPNFEDGLRNQEILEAIEISAHERRWVDLPLNN